MADEMKTRSIRADEETLEKFKNISEEFANQGECLSTLINAYEIAKAKNTLTNMQTDIEDYESHISAIQKAFLHVLELNENTEVRCREELGGLLNSKDKTIEDLQQRLSDAEDKQKAAELETENNKSELDNVLNELDNAKVRIDKLEKDVLEHKNIIKDKQTIIDSINLKVDEAERIKSESESKDKTILALKDEVDTKGKSIAQLQAEIDKCKSDAEIASKQFELDKQLAVNSVKSEFIDKIELIRTEKEQKIEEVRDERDKLLSENSILRDKIRKLESIQKD